MKGTEEARDDEETTIVAVKLSLVVRVTLNDDTSNLSQETAKGFSDLLRIVGMR